MRAPYQPTNQATNQPYPRGVLFGCLRWGKSSALGPCDDPVAFAQFAGILLLGVLTSGDEVDGKKPPWYWDNPLQKGPKLKRKGLSSRKSIVRGYVVGFLEGNRQ